MSMSNLQVLLFLPNSIHDFRGKHDIINYNIGTEMTISTREAAKKICELSNWEITNLELQKMLYLSHLYFLGRNDVPLIDEEFEAWQYGPVLNNLYHQLKIFGNKPITNIFYGVEINEDAREIQFLSEEYAELSNKSPYELIVMTHLKGGAWENCYQEGHNIIIPDAQILQEYRDFYAERFPMAKKRHIIPPIYIKLLKRYFII